MIVSVASNCCLVVAGLNLNSPSFAEQLKFIKNPSLLLRSTDPHKWLYYREWELAKWQDWLRKAEKEYPKGHYLIISCKLAIIEQKIKIDDLEFRLDHPQPVPMINMGRTGPESVEVEDKRIEKLNQDVEKARGELLKMKKSLLTIEKKGSPRSEILATEYQILRKEHSICELIENLGLSKSFRRRGYRSLICRLLHLLAFKKTLLECLLAQSSYPTPLAFRLLSRMVVW